MKQFRFHLILLITLVLISSCGKDDHDLRKHKEIGAMAKETVEKNIDAVWLSNATLPLGGLLLGRGEGMNGVITLSITRPTDAPTGPVLLTASDITSMDITVMMPDGTEKHFQDPEIATAGYLIGFHHEWSGGGPVVEYIIVNNYKCE